MTDLKTALKPKFRAQSRQFFLLLGLTIVTMSLGLAMVASSSAVDSFKQSGDAGALFYRQLLYAGIGLVGLIIASNMPMGFYRRFGSVLLLSTLGLQVATVLFGADINGNRNWLSLGPFSLQPSEFLKLAMVIAFAYWLSQLGDDPFRNRQIWLRLLVYSAISLVLVAVLGRDLGTGVVMAVMLGFLFLFAGMAWSLWLSIAFGGAALAIALIQASPSRRIRFDAWLNPDTADPMGVRWQFEHGTWALASGGVFGTGLGRSKLKWSWIPEVENDFIFAIIGEELGLVGAMFVILLFFAIGLTMFSIAKNQTSPFNRYLVVGVMLWVVMQAFINIAVVLGLLPVLGVPLPLVSAGGSSLIATLGAIGLVLAVERDRVLHLGRRS
jgi:cell division protein FtsW